MSYSPKTEVILLSMPKLLTPKHQMTFRSQKAQQVFFKQYTKYTFNNFTYQRKNSTIRVPLLYDDASTCNYVMYKNEESGVPYIYANILGYKYLSDSVTEITIQTDVFQTWQFNFNIMPSFVDRMHIPYTDSTRYWQGYLEEEDIDLGSPVVLEQINVPELLPIFAIAYNRNPVEDGYVRNPPAQIAYAPILNNVPNGLYFRILGGGAVAQALYEMREHSDAIVSVFSMPQVAVNGLNRNKGWKISGRI